MRSCRALLGVVMISTIAFTAIPVGAAPYRRTVKESYRGPGEIEIGPVVIFMGAIDAGGEQVTGAVRFDSRQDERFVHLEIADETGGPVKGHVEQRLRGRSRLLGHFCGSTDRPFRIKPGRPVFVYPGTAPCGGGATGATQGVVTARFSR